MSDEIIDPHHSRRDLRMIEAAIKKGWKIPEDVRARLPEAIAEIALNEGTDKSGKKQKKRYDVRARVGAARVLVQMDRANGQHDRNEQREREADAPPPSTQINVGVQVNTGEQPQAPIEIVHVDDWYGTPKATDDDDDSTAKDLPAAQPAPPAAGSP
jgi:hypothetical protein